MSADKGNRFEAAKPSHIGQQARSRGEGALAAGNLPIPAPLLPASLFPAPLGIAPYKETSCWEHL